MLAVSFIAEAQLGGALNRRPECRSKTVTASESMAFGDINFVFTFIMPANAVNDLVITNTFAPAGPIYNASDIAVINAVIASTNLSWPLHGTQVTFTSAHRTSTSTPSL